ncbi:MAG: glycerol acyltransferase, partial [Bacteroidales bacterium]|nr:glycerol acyltransferase [Bacteroidales bacterium]
MNYSKDNQDNKPEKFVDVEEVIRNKNPHLLKILPGFILRYLKRIIHENEINSFLNKSRNKFGLDFVDTVLDEFGAKIVVKGEENIPKTGKYIIASNHPLGGLDGIALMSVVGKIRKDLIVPVNDILLYLTNLKELFIPINKHGSNTENIKIINDTFASDVILLYFPAGLVSRKQSG